jgi:hypothetical protein
MEPGPTAAKILIIRHAEKPPEAGSPAGVTEDGVVDPESLTARGWQRAGALACLLAPRRGRLQDPALATPQMIFASEHSSDQGSQRSLQTIRPLARTLKIEPRTFKKNALEKVASAALSSPGIVLISWQHEDIPTIAGFIPCNDGTIPQKWPGDRFDLVWVFDLDPSSASYRFSQVTQQLLEGDGPEPIA